jgi:hypothetical protein
MTPQSDNTWVDAAIREASPVTEGDLDNWGLEDGYQSLLRQVASTDVVAGVVAMRHRRLSPKASGLALTAVLVFGAGAAAAVGGGALTGVFGNPGSTENDTSEYVNPLSPGYPALERQVDQSLLSDGLRFPPRFDTHALIDNLVNEAIADTKQIERGSSPEDKLFRTHGLRIQVTGIKGTFAGLAQCAWEYTWLGAYAARNRTGESVAVRGMAALNGVITTTPTANGTHTGSITAETNRKKTLIQDVRLMKHGDVSFFQNDTSINCAHTGTGT